MDEDKYTRITLRIPRELHSKLTAAADATSKSMNAEIIARLNETFAPSSTTLVQDESRSELRLVFPEGKADVFLKALNNFLYPPDIVEKTLIDPKERKSQDKKP